MLFTSTCECGGRDVRGVGEDGKGEGRVRFWALGNEEEPASNGVGRGVGKGLL
jgi:hypothetical protein